MIRLATRGSPLALWQAETVKRAILREDPRESVELVLVRTPGDEVQDRAISAIGSVNVFTAEVDRTVFEGRADAGVHSLKDLGTELAPGLVLGAVLERGFVEDVLIAPRWGRLSALPAGATIGSGSLRRQAMLLRWRPDLRCSGLRGNVDTRIAKVERGEVDAAIMARAGLERLGLGRVISEVLPLDRFLPAAGQGLVGITCRADDARVAGALRGVCDEAGFAAGAAERALLRELEAGCHAPVGALATVDRGRLTLRCRVLARDGTSEVAGVLDGHVGEAERIGRDLARRLLAEGARPLLAPE